MKYLPAILSFCLLILNLFTFLGNVIFAIFQQKNQRKYESEFQLYSKLILEKINEYILFSANLEIELDKIISKCKTISSTEKRKQIEESCDKIEILFKEAERNLIILIHCYSEPLFHLILQNCENLYDSTTELISSLDQNAISAQFENLLKERYKRNKTIFLKSFYSNIKRFKPKT